MDGLTLEMTYVGIAPRMETKVVPLAYISRFFFFLEPDIGPGKNGTGLGRIERSFSFPRDVNETVHTQLAIRYTYAHTL